MTTSQMDERRSMARRAAIAATAGTALEYYDFTVYGYLAVVLAPLFFPASSPGTGLLVVLAIYGAGWVARPVGGVVFGWLGDRVGRRKVLLITVGLIGVATVLTGLLPTYAAIGIGAPILLAVLRIVQGFAAGGEAPGAATYVSESVPAKERGLFGSATGVGVALGIGSSATVVGLVTLVAGSQGLANGAWRIPFLIALPLLAATLIYRLKIEDSPLFNEMLAKGAPAKAPVKEVFRKHPRGLATVFGIAFGHQTSTIIGGYLVVHLSTLGYKITNAVWIAAVVALIPIVVMRWSGKLSDRIGRRKVLAFGFLGYVVLGVPCFWLMQQDSLVLALIAAAILNLPFGVIQGAVFSMYTEQFPTAVRYTGVSIGFNLAGLVGGAPAALVASWLVQTTGSTLSPSYFLIFGAVVALLTIATLRETAGSDLRSEDGLGAVGKDRPASFMAGPEASPST